MIWCGGKNGSVLTEAEQEEHPENPDGLWNDWFFQLHKADDSNRHNADEICYTQPSRHAPRDQEEPRLPTGYLMEQRER